MDAPVISYKLLSYNGYMGNSGFYDDLKRKLGGRGREGQGCMGFVTLCRIMGCMGEGIEGGIEGV